MDTHGGELEEEYKCVRSSEKEKLNEDDQTSTLVDDVDVSTRAIPPWAWFY